MHIHDIKNCVLQQIHSSFSLFWEIIIDDSENPFTTTKPAGFGPAEFRKAYGVSGEAKKRQLLR
jgi:hypothetical protein